MDMTLLAAQLPIGCQTATHADGQIEVYRDYQNGNRFTQAFDPTADEVETATTVFGALYAYKNADATDATTPDFTPGATIDI